MSAEPERMRIATRWAERRDLPRLRTLMNQAIEGLQQGLLSPEQIAASHAIMGLDTQLVEDGTYRIAEMGGVAVGCGGWSGRATLYGGDHGEGLRAPALLDPAIDPVRIRAMYTHPDHARRGIGRRILHECETAAAGAGFSTMELMATLSGHRLYAVTGYTAVEHVAHVVDGIAVPLVRMRKRLGG